MIERDMRQINVDTYKGGIEYSPEDTEDSATEDDIMSHGNPECDCVSCIDHIIYT